ncbi:FRG domain-containing protein [Paraburkholderia sp. J8-2]|uniref:FRG domain-containing protein n=1 Tax=Paraburkholderia sp. J8-2 TaxID=2805440 RepID=UPI002AB7D803|nr:FRG domain-containing protein [Paraburkholderia sp. J8-2]
MKKAKTPKTPSLVGQWTGSFQATEIEGTLVIDLEELSGQTVGSVMMFPKTGAPVMVGKIWSIYSAPDRAFAAISLNPVNPQFQNLVMWEQIPQVFPNMEIAKKAQAVLTWTDSKMEVRWHSDINRQGNAALTRNDPTRASELPTRTMNWADFKTHVTGLLPRKYVFRGQQKPWRLRSHFHRTGRSDLLRYTLDDLPTLHRHLSARTRHIFNRQISDENGAFLHLAQHHGFPTPLIDWTYSPFVAAFFAFRKITISDSKKRNAGNVRIFLFDQAEWRDSVAPISITAPALPHFSLMEFMAIENERLIPQQALSALTNVDDVESFIDFVEKLHAKRYLTAIDIPAKERETVMRELALMGITAGALFPGLDGSCEELRERLFPT